MELRIEPSSRVPIYRQLAEQVREAVALGKLQAGDKLPSVRELSRKLVVNPNTVARVYTELEREGVLHTRPGLGAFVARPGSELTKRARRQRLVHAVDALLTEAVHLGFTESEVRELLSERSGRFQWDADTSN
jgi:GntR family transcriptional regulator